RPLRGADVGRGLAGAGAVARHGGRRRVGAPVADVAGPAGVVIPAAHPAALALRIGVDRDRRAGAEAARDVAGHAGARARAGAADAVDALRPVSALVSRGACVARHAARGAHAVHAERAWIAVRVATAGARAEPGLIGLLHHRVR